MAGISDTSPEAEEVLREIWRSMPFERKWRQMGILYHTGKVLHEAGMRARNPNVTREEIHADWLAQAGIELVPPIRRVPVMLGNEEAIQVVHHVVAILEKLSIAYALAGSWASSIHGKMRTTHDADYPRQAAVSRQRRGLLCLSGRGLLRQPGCGPPGGSQTLHLQRDLHADRLQGRPLRRQAKALRSSPARAPPARVAAGFRRPTGANRYRRGCHPAQARVVSARRRVISDAVARHPGRLRPATADPRSCVSGPLGRGIERVRPAPA